MPLNPQAPAMPGMILRAILRTDGTVELLDRKHSIGDLARMISGGLAIDSVSIKEPFEFELPQPYRTDAAAADVPVPPPPRFRVPVGYVLLVRDEQSPDLPLNRNATAIYWRQCRSHTDPPPMLGDAALVPDSDFGSAL